MKTLFFGTNHQMKKMDAEHFASHHTKLQFLVPTAQGTVEKSKTSCDSECHTLMRTTAITYDSDSGNDHDINDIEMIFGIVFIF